MVALKLSHKTKILLYWNVRRVDRHFSDAVEAIDKQYDVTFIGNNKYRNSVSFEDVNPKDYDLLLAYDSGSQTFNESGNRYDHRVDDIVGIPRVLRAVDIHLRPAEYAAIAATYDKVLYTSPAHASYLEGIDSEFVPPHTNVEMYSVDNVNSADNIRAITEKRTSINLNIIDSNRRYIDISYLTKFRDPRAERAQRLFGSLPVYANKWIIAKAFYSDAAYIYSRSMFSLHLKCDKFVDNYATWRPLDAMACGAVPIIEVGDDDTWRLVEEFFAIDHFEEICTTCDVPCLDIGAFQGLHDRENMMEAAKEFDIRKEPKRILERI